MDRHHVKPRAQVSHSRCCVGTAACWELGPTHSRCCEVAASTWACLALTLRVLWTSVGLETPKAQALTAEDLPGACRWDVGCRMLSRRLNVGEAPHPTSRRRIPSYPSLFQSVSSPRPLLSEGPLSAPLGTCHMSGLAPPPQCLQLGELGDCSSLS